MPLYLGTEEAGTQSFTLQDVLPTPITLLRESHVIETTALAIGFAIVWFVLLRGVNQAQSVPREARYAGMGLAMATLATANWIAFRVKWELATYLGTALMAHLSPLKQYSTTWYTLAKVANLAHYSILVLLILLIWQRRETLGQGVLRVVSLVKSANGKV